MTKQNKTIKVAAKFLLALFVIVLLWAFFNDSTYNLVKRKLVKNSEMYTEMYAYTKSKPSFTEKYFILQGNNAAKSFFQNGVNFVSEDKLKDISCSKEDTYLIYEKPSAKVSDFIKSKQGEEYALNQQSNIQFYAAKIKNENPTCRVGN